MLTEKDYCDYETSITLGELGFPLKRMKVKNFIEGKFSDSIVTVLLYEAQKWLREEKNIHITINYICLDENIFMYTLRYIGKELREGGGLYNNEQYSSYEEALSEGIKESVKILKKYGTM